MDFVISFPKKPKGNDVIWVGVVRLTKSTYFIPIKISFLLEKLVKVYISVVVKLHDIPSSIFLIETRDSR